MTVLFSRELSPRLNTPIARQPNMLESFEWKDVGFTTGAGKPILQGITGSIQAGGLLALMGPSGCGKTTLLNCLAKRQQGNVTGHISIDGVEATPSLIQRLASYVPQEDHLIGALTVRETINISAMLSIDTKSKAERLERVAALIEAFGLSVCADTTVGTALLKGISGGQKRRLSVASQLITLPEIVFLDEPVHAMSHAASTQGSLTEMHHSCITERLSQDLHWLQREDCHHVFILRFSFMIRTTTAPHGAM